MAHQKHGFVWKIANRVWDGALGVWFAIHRIVHAGQPESAAGPVAEALDGQAGVVEHGDAVGGQGCGDLFGSNGDIVVAKNCVELTAL